ncbi:MAG: nuclear transport factor 2 family protein [Bacteroidaceae bacterium]|nr:nuclear transport factor 2 family protein [Bacteroidaceae bacterium]
MNKLFLPLFLLLASVTHAADITVTITDGVDNAAVKQRMETATARILNEVNAAQVAGRNLNFAFLGLSQRVQQSMAMLWENAPFICTDEEIIEHGITTGSGYQIRNIPLLMKPTGEREFNEDEYQEAVISFDQAGEVESFYLTISMNLYMKVIRDNRELTDLRRRQMILDYVEQFRTSYNQKDINFLEQVFSDDALIITGKVIQQRHGDGMTSPKVQYNKQTKQQYLSNLRRVFQNTKYIKVNFDDIEVMRHPVNPDFYGVTLHQGWTSNTYHDEGYVFLLWDFRNENAPQIHVRTWQPDKIGKKALPKDEIFTLDDFNIE